MRSLLAGVPFVLCIALCAAVRAAPPSDAELGARVDAIAAASMAEPNAVGLSVAVARGDKVIVAKGYGKADLEFAVPMDAQTMLRIGSVTKQFSAAAAMKLVEQGKLSLDDTLDKMLPEFPATGPVTLRHILNHTSGIWSYTQDGAFMKREASLELTPAELVATFKDRPLEFQPGTKWNYSNSAYYLLGEIVARASGRSYAQYVQEEFFTTLGLDRTRYESNREVMRNRAQGYGFEEGVLVNDRPIGPDVPGAAGALLSNAEGLVRWSLALAGGKVVSADSYAQMTTPGVLPDGNGTEYGFGLGIDTWEKRKRISHGGGIFGFSSMLAYLPDDKVTVAVISNCDAFNPGRVADSIMRAALGLTEFVALDLPVHAAEASRFAGEYASEEVPFEISIVERAGQVFAQSPGQRETRLLYQGKGEFRPDFDHQVRIVFPAGDGPAAGLVLHQGGELAAKRKP